MILGIIRERTGGGKEDAAIDGRNKGKNHNELHEFIRGF
ncbi:hypothetical protein RV08_GL000975 [Enterococcus mundtii]|nr:hypothetical protein RV08_GL000975 [Enterococcus mundtii]